MQKLLAALLALASAGCFFAPRWIVFEDVSVYVPSGFAHTISQGGLMTVSMAETSVEVIIEKVSGEGSFHDKVEQSVALSRRAYGEGRVKVSKIAELGKLNGHGVVIVTTNPDDSDLKAEQLLFLIDRPPWRMVSAGCSSGDDAVWSSYHQILSNLALR